MKPLAELDLVRLEIVADALRRRPVLIAEMIRKTLQLYTTALARLDEQGADALRRQYRELIDCIWDMPAPQAFLDLRQFASICAEACSNIVMKH